MRAALAYSPKPAPLGTARPSVALVYLLPLALAAFAFSNPIVLAAAAVATLLVGRLSGAMAAVAASLRYGAYLAATIILINGLVSQRGDTILVRGWDLPVVGQLDISAEALAEGSVLALRILIVIAISAIWSACVDPDRLVRAIRPYAGRSALTATLISRMVPLAAADGARLSEAASLRGPAAAPVGRVEIARRLIAGGLDRSVDIAATLELRGYGLDRRIRNPSERLDRGELRLLAAGVASLIGVVAALSLGWGGFDAYPLIEVDAGAGTLTLAAALPILALLPLRGSDQEGQSRG